MGVRMSCDTNRICTAHTSSLDGETSLAFPFLCACQSVSEEQTYDKVTEKVTHLSNVEMFDASLEPRGSPSQPQNSLPFGILSQDGSNLESNAFLPCTGFFQGG